MSAPTPAARTGQGSLAGLRDRLILPVSAILLSLVVGAIVIYLSLIVTGQPMDIGLPLQAYAALFEGAFGSLDAIVNTLVSTTPLILGGLSVALAFKAGLFNIGATGQFLLGAVGAVAMGVTLAGQPPIVAIPLAMAAGMLAGAFWGFIPGALKAFTGAHEVVTTIMLNYIAYAVVAWSVSYPLDTPESPEPLTASVGNAALPILIGRNGHFGIVLAFVAVAIVWWLLSRTTLGFEIRTVGANPDAARYAGMHPRMLIILTMTLAGLLAGSAGAVTVLGVLRNMQATLPTTVGFDAIAVALLARSNPVGIIFSALLFGSLRSGAALMQIRVGIPAELIDVLQATMLLFLIANPLLRYLRRRRGPDSSPALAEAGPVLGDRGAI
jgi:general nucleoside transport system permease protein